jgi:hypothetical protein
MSGISAARLRVGVALLWLTSAAVATSQSTTLKVTSTDNTPIPYAWVAIRGRDDAIADAQGQLDLGPGRHQKIQLEVRRIGFQPWSGTLTTPNEAGVLTVALSRSARNPATPTLNNSQSKKTGLELVGFYDRWLRKMYDKKNGATFIGPEMIEKRNPRSTTDMLDHVSGVTLIRTSKGVRGAMGKGEGAITAALRSAEGQPLRFDRECFMSIVVDNGPACPAVGCHHVFANDPPGSTSDEHIVDLDRLIDPKLLMGIEVYPNKDAMPDEVLYQYEGCGLIVFWTGSRKP